MRISAIAIVAAVSGIVFGSLATSPEADAAERRYISIGTGGPTGVYFQVGSAICRMVHKEAAEGRKSGRKHGIRCSAPSTGGSTYNIGQIAEGELDFGVAQSDWQYNAVNCTSEKVTCYSDLRALFSVHPEPFQIIVGKNSRIKKWRDLKGKRVNIGNPGSGQRGTMEVLMEAHRTKPSQFAQTLELSSSEQSQALCDGKIDAYGYTVGVPNAGVAAATDGCGAKIISLNSRVEKRLVRNNAYYAFATIPAGTYATSNKDVTTFGVMATVVTSADVAPDLVYEVVRAVFENLDDFRKLHPAFANLDPKRMIKNGLSADLHPGAARYFKEQGWM